MTSRQRPHQVHAPRGRRGERADASRSTIWIEDDRIYFSFPVGLKAYGFHALRDVEILPTDDDILDGILGEAAAAIGRRINPTTFDATAGRMQGDRECKVRPGEVR